MKIIITLALLFALSFGSAYAEEFQDVITFPIPDNVDNTFKKCGIEKVDATEFIFSCDWKFTAEQADKWFDEIQKELGLIISQDDDIQTSDDIKTEPEESPLPFAEILAEDEDHQFDYYTADAKRCVDDPPKDYAGKDYCNDLRELELCQRGIDEAKGIQNREAFITSDSDEFLRDNDRPEYTPFKFGGTSGDLKKAKLDCIYQEEILKPIILGVETFNKGVFFGVTQPYHADKAIVSDYWNRVPIQSDFNLNYRDLFDTNEEAFDNMCTSENVSFTFKQQQGCPDTRERLPDTHPKTIIPDYPNHPLIQAYNDWKVDPNSNLDEIFEKIQREKINNENIGGKQ